MFWIRRPPVTSAGVTLYERILSGSTQTFICRSCPPMIVIWPTPLTDSIRSLTCVLRNLRHLAKICRCRNNDAQDRCGIAVEFLNRRLLGGFRQIRNHGLNAVLNLLRRDVYVLFKNELDEDLRDAFDRGRTQLVDTADRVDRFLDLFSYLGFHLLRRRTGIDRP